jgi:Cu/Ag efflux protein CusF
MQVKTLMIAAGLLMATSGLAVAQAPVSKAEMLKATATIQQIDQTNRLITIRTPDGLEDIVWAGPEVKRFDELKVGDKVSMAYYESRVYRLRKPGDPPLSAGGSAVTPAKSALPGATVSKQTTATVTVKSVDQNVGTITVTTKDGRVISRKVDDKSNLTGVKAGDQIDIIYTEALLVSVERAN